MSEPTRWKDGGGPPELGALLAGGRRSRPLPEAARDRARARLAATTVPVAASVLLGWKSVAVAAAVVASGVVAAGVAAVARDPSPAPREHAPHDRANAPELRPAPSAPAPTVDAITPPEAPQASAPPPAPPRAHRAPTPAPLEAPGAPEDTLEREVALLTKARASLTTEPRETLRLVDVHARDFAEGKLVLERELLAVDALEALGRRDAARARAGRLLARARGTIYEARVRDRLGAVSP